MAVYFIKVPRPCLPQTLSPNFREFSNPELDMYSLRARDSVALLHWGDRMI